MLAVGCEGKERGEEGRLRGQERGRGRAMRVKKRRENSGEEIGGV